MRHLRGSMVVALLALSALAAAPALPQNDQSGKVDDYVKAEMERRKIPGLSIAVVRDGEIIKAQGYGLAHLELKVAAAPETIYQSGSVGKQFTATLVMMLAEEGKLSLDDRISKHIPEAPETWKDITVRHLLTHTSGISPARFYETIDFRRDYTEDELLKEIMALPLDFQPGEKWSYSNPGYVTLGILIQKVTGRFYGDLLRERIFQPLGMTTARILNEEDIIPNRAAGYRLVNGEWKNQEWVAPQLNTTADGSLYLTVLDLAKWDAALYTEKLLKRSSFDQMWTPARLNNGRNADLGYGFGWMTGALRGNRFVRHGGGWQGFSTHILRYVDRRLTVIVLTNLANLNAAPIADGIAGLYEPEVAPAERTAIQIDPRILNAYLGEYEIVPGFILTVFREGDSLWIQATGQGRAQLAAESETTFFLEDADVAITFVKNAKGAVTHALLYQSGNVTEIEKIR
jgi:CubicO group peptidase (beta-lactamase class C family)